MQTESITISNKAPGSTALDFNALRKVAIEHIQAVAGKVWTDHNLHDPGITMLEVLAYAITDISSRANADIKDVIASSSKDLSDNFFTASEIFPNYPVTINDFRKILIDLDPIRNAWLETTDDYEIPIYMDQESGKINFSTGEKVDLRGLYNVLLEFNEVEIDTGDPTDPTKVVDINNSVLLHPPINISGTDISIEIAFPYWDQMPEDWSTDLSIDEVLLESLSGDKLITLDETQNEDFFGVLIVHYDTTKSYKIGIRVKVNTEDHGLTEVDLKNGIINALEITTAEIAIDSAVIDTSLIKEFNRRVMAALEIITEVKEYLHNYRNLCEDFYAFRSIRVQEIALNVDLEIFSNTNVEKALGQIFFEIGQFLSPAIRFYTLDEMLSKGYAVEEIFEGPLLENGFIENNDLIDLKREDIIYTSDLVRIILAQNTSLLSGYSNKVISVNDLKISNFINNQPLTTDVRNCLKLAQIEVYKPRLSVEKSQVRVFREGVEIDYDIAKVIDEYNILKLEAAINSSVVTTNDLPIPAGMDQEVEDYHSIQHHFPLAYGIGEEGIPGLAEIKGTSDRNLRIAQAKQLKAYLLFFEQMLAGYLSQLKHIGDLFSNDPNIIPTYFAQPLYDVPGVSSLLRDFTSSGLSWEDFIKDPDNSYVSYLQHESNESEVTLDRKNRFLDHLLGRFSESFVEYGLLLAKQPDSIGLINDKSTFLRQYPLLSSQRFKAFNYLKQLDAGIGPDVWDTNNVSGIQKRIAKKLGIKSYNRRNLFVAPSTYFSVVASGPDFIAQLQDDGGLTILSSVKYATNPQAVAAIDGLIDFGLYKKNYKIEKDSGTGMYQGQLLDETEVVIGIVEGTYITKEEAYEAIDNVLAFIHEKFSAEGIFLIEHLLLRPKRRNVPTSGGPASDKLLDGFPNRIDGYVEPYSFCVSVIMPSGLTNDTPPALETPQRFGDTDFKTFAEKTIRRELPAHVKADIYWLRRDEIIAFEPVYRAWLEKVADISSTEEDLVTAQNDLIDQLKTIISNV